MSRSVECWAVAQDDPIELTVAEVRTAVPAGPGVEAGVALLQEKQYPHRLLRIYMGRPEAKAIDAAVQGELPMRPSTWDLLVSAVSILEGELTEALIIDVQEERHYFAQLALKGTNGDTMYLTARPSDAIALALRAHGCTITAMPHVLDEAGLLADGTRWVGPDADPAWTPDTASAAEVPVVEQSAVNADPTAVAAATDAAEDQATGDKPETSKKDKKPKKDKEGKSSSKAKSSKGKSSQGKGKGTSKGKGKPGKGGKGKSG